MGLTVEDRLAVQDLIILYGHMHDSKQPHRIGDEIFAEDGEIDFGTGKLIGRSAIQAFFGSFDGLYDTSHIITNFIIEGDGDRARCHSHCLAWHWLKRPDVDGRPSLHPVDTLIVGGYDDQLRRESAGWRITRRRTVQYGTGLGAGVIDESLRPILEGCLGRLPEWP
jgi:hypothetical protein